MNTKPKLLRGEKDKSSEEFMRFIDNIESDRIKVLWYNGFEGGESWDD